MAFLECPECSEELHPSTGSNPAGEPVWSESDARTCQECGVISWVSVDSDEGEAYVNTEHETGWKQAVARIAELEAEVERLRGENEHLFERLHDAATIRRELNDDADRLRHLMLEAVGMFHAKSVLFPAPFLRAARGEE